MQQCSAGHEAVRYECFNCPVCAIEELLDEKIEQLQSENQLLQDELDGIMELLDDKKKS